MQQFTKSTNLQFLKSYNYKLSGIISYVVFSFRRLAISAALFLVVFNNFGICKISCSTYYCDLH